MSDHDYERLPKQYETYAKIIKSLIPFIGDKEGSAKAVNNQNAANNKSKANSDTITLPEATYSLKRLNIDKSNLQDYCRICGFADNGQVPSTYFAVVSQTLQMNMMVDEPFPFALLGLIHVTNTITQYRRIADTEIVSMTVSFANLRNHDKGQQFDFVTQVYSQDVLVWEGVSTYLSRQKHKTTPRTKPSKAVIPKSNAKQDDLHHVFAVPEDIGRRYAKVSGDYNLIHIHTLTARMLGFHKAIAHGMWSKAKCLSLMDLPEAYTVEVAFKLPIFLPSEVELISDNMTTLQDSGEAKFELYSAKDDKPHLAGMIKTV